MIVGWHTGKRIGAPASSRIGVTHSMQNPRHYRWKGSLETGNQLRLEEGKQSKNLKILAHPDHVNA